MRCHRCVTHSVRFGILSSNLLAFAFQATCWLLFRTGFLVFVSSRGVVHHVPREWPNRGHRGLAAVQAAGGSRERTACAGHAPIGPSEEHCAACCPPSPHAVCTSPLHPESPLTRSKCACAAVRGQKLSLPGPRRGLPSNGPGGPRRGSAAGHRRRVAHPTARVIIWVRQQRRRRVTIAHPAKKGELLGSGENSLKTLDLDQGAGKFVIHLRTAS